ncbi:uncharacterized protein LOC118755597 isoform X2 [Rhagoletis pomonella]|uniref:uncharacterized protein LOC118755597 isoform X2 n=1 Tax=Rhagoletis pomonella TaxID=28610 RepID=UPI001784D53B|nr:uncharacterized protein LOC118755597 isoform X2 [Rhagoletis pomonella]
MKMHREKGTVAQRILELRLNRVTSPLVIIQKENSISAAKRKASSRHNHNSDFLLNTILPNKREDTHRSQSLDELNALSICPFTKDERVVARQFYDRYRQINCIVLRSTVASVAYL